MKIKVLILFLFIFSVCAHASERLTPVVSAVDRVKDSVVNIRAESLVKRSGPFGDPFFDEFMGFGGTYRNQSMGTGVIIRSDGIVVTNYHVIEESTKIFIICPDEQTYTATVIGGDSLLDIAILKIDDMKKPFQSLPLGRSSDVLPGETVIAIGNPYGLSSSVTTGVISNKRRVLKVDNDFAVFIQTDALINPGNSGGPLINLDGEVIGINSAIYKDAQGIGFAIPIDTVKRVLPEIMKYQYIRRGYLGFALTGSKKPDVQGLYVSDVVAVSDAARLGIREGNYLIRLDGLPVSSPAAVNYILRTFPPGEIVKAVFLQDGKEVSGDIRLTEYPKDAGINMLKHNYGIDVRLNNGTITVYQSKYPQYIKQGDTILAVNGKEVKSMNALDTVLANSAYEKLSLRLSRNRYTFEIMLEP